MRQVWQNTPYQKFKSANEAANFLEQHDELVSIPENIELTPDGDSHGSRDYKVPEGLFKSVTKPNTKKTPEEETLEPTKIDLDCDQVRLMIKLFVRNSEWFLDEFRLTLGGVARPELTKFLELRGPRAGERRRAFPLCWEFFK